MTGATTPIDGGTPEPRREGFEEKALPAEPKTDVRIEAENGMALRERVARIDNGQGMSLRFTYTRLDPGGEVMRDSSGNPMIAPAHEIVLIGQNVTRMGDGASVDSIRHGREIGVAKAVDHFAGIETMPGLLADRIA